MKCSVSKFYRNSKFWRHEAKVGSGKSVGVAQGPEPPHGRRKLENLSKLKIYCLSVLEIFLYIFTLWALEAANLKPKKTKSQNQPNPRADYEGMDKNSRKVMTFHSLYG